MPVPPVASLLHGDPVFRVDALLRGCGVAYLMAGAQTESSSPSGVSRSPLANPGSTTCDSLAR